MRKIRIAQIGINVFSHAIPVFQTLVKQSDLFEIAGYVLVEDEREKFKDKLSVFDGYPELTLDEVLNDPTIEAVAIETEEVHLTKYALLAAAHHKHIHMEKPGGLSLEDFEELIATVKQNGTVFHTGYMYRYNPFIKELVTSAKNGELGDIVSIEAQMSCLEPDDLHAWLGTFPGGMMFFLGCHLIDLCLQIKGMPEQIHPFNLSSGKNGLQVKDSCHALLTYPDGAASIKTAANEIGAFARRKLVVTGTKKAIELCPLEMGRGDGQYTGRTVHADPAWHTVGVCDKSDIHGRYDEMMASFAAYVAGEKENPYTYDYELALFKTVLKCCE